VKFITKQQNKTTCKYKLLNKITIYKKEKFISCKAYYILGFMFLKKRIKPNRQTTYLFGLKIKDKKFNLVPKILPYANGKDFIYYCFHTGDFYYLCQIIKVNMDKFKNTVIITNFKELKQVLYLFDFNEDWINEHFVVVPKLWYFSYALHCKSDGSIISEMELDHEKGWIVNGKLQKENGKYLPINRVIQNFIGINNIAKPQLTDSQISKNNTIFIMPESQFNGNLDIKILTDLVNNLINLGYKVAINTNSNRYDSLLSDDVYKIFLPYKETFNFVCNCEAIIGVRSGLFDCLQELVNLNVKCFVIYQNQKYPHYKFFKKFHFWFTQVYSFNKINNCEIYNEYFTIEEFTSLNNNINSNLTNKEKTHA